MRLTNKDQTAKYGYKYVAPDRFDNFGEGCHKLGKLEDIEDELGIDLITFFKALKNGAFIKLNDGRIIEGFSPTTQEFPVYIYFTVWGKDVNSNYDLDEKGVYSKDYGKTWALTKEELI